jgi:hypothetical protein
MTNEHAIAELLTDAEDQASTPEDFEYDAPVAVRIAVLVSEAASHVIARDRLQVQLSAAKIQGGNQKQIDDMTVALQLQKLCVGRCFVSVKAIGMTDAEFRIALDAELKAAVPQRR